MLQIKNKFLPVVLCGGSGKRLWPVSRKALPKQFVPLFEGKSLLELTLSRLSPLAEQIICITNEDHRFLVVEAQEAAAVSGPLILEPVGKNTSAAMALAALYAQSQGQSDACLLFCPADHHIPDTEAFIQTIHKSLSAARTGAFVTFGVTPTFPSTAYGYIEKGVNNPDGGYTVNRFIEKPAFEDAQALLLAGNVLWNAGIFMVRADVLIKTLSDQAPDILATCDRAMKQSIQENMDRGHVFVRPDANIFNTCRSESIDYAVLEKHPHVVTIPFTSAWSDVGSWNAVAELTPSDDDGNRVHGHGSVHHGCNTYIYAPNRQVAALGTQDLIIIDTPDALLVAHRSNVEQVKNVVDFLESEGCESAIAHRRVSRPWGWYDSVDMGPRFQVKRIGVKPGASLSLQKHHHRAEHWIVVKGTAEVTRGEDTFILSENQSTYISIGEVHRLSNPGIIELEIIEVQSGDYLGEDDIVRLEDTYGRVAN